MQGRVSNCTGVPSCCSSRCAVPKKGRNYKPIENFLRRIAFNLGNSVSQTDVKIVSCIPIDVTDFQQRITQLEKELEEAKGSNNKEGKDDKGGKEGNGGSRRASKASKAEAGKEAEKEETVAWMNKSKVKKASNAGRGKEAEKEGLVEWTEKTNITKKSTSSLPIHKDYMKNYLNEEENEVHPLYIANTDKKYNDTGRLNDTVNSATSFSVEMDLTTQHTSGRIKNQKQNPFSVFMGNMRRRKHSNAQKFPSNCPNDDFTYSASNLSIIACPSVSKTNNHKDSESEDKYQKSQTFTKRKKISKGKNKSSNLHDQYVYYMQTDSNLNPISKKKQDNKEFDMLYIADLVERQYGPTELLKKKNGLHREYSVPVFHDKRYSDEYPISGFGPRSCFSGTNSRHDVNRGLLDNTGHNLKGSSQEHNYYCKNKGRFYDCTQYDIVPVKQKASKKYSEQAKYAGVGHRSGRSCSPSKKCYANMEPPLKRPHSFDMIRNSNKQLQNHSYLDRGLRRRETKSYVTKKNSPKRSCLKNAINRQNYPIYPEDFLQSTNTREPASTIRTHEQIIKTQVEPELKSNEITEVKAMLENFITEFKKDIPKLQENLNAKPEDHQVCTEKTSAKECAFVPGFTQISAGQCCPILYPINLITPTHTAHACVHKTPALHREPSECCITKGKSDMNTASNQDGQTETKKLLEEIYKSITLQNINNEYNTKAIVAKGNETMKDIVNSSSTMPSSASQELPCKSLSNPSPSNRKLSEQITETESKDQNLSDRSASSVHTDSYVTSYNAREPSDTKIKTEKRGVFSSFMQAFKLSFKKNQEMYSEMGKSYRHNVDIEQESDTSRHNKLHPLSKMYSKHTTKRPVRHNTHCKTANIKRSSGQYPEPRETTRHRKIPQACTQYSKKPHRRHQDRRPYESDEPNNCFYMSEAQQIPYCLKEIEVKNVSTQVKKKKLFGILRRLTHATDSDTSFEHRSPTRENYKAETDYVPQQRVYKKKKPSFLELLKGKADIDYSNKINKYNLANGDSESLEARPEQRSFFSPKQGSKGKWTKYMQKFEKAKKRDMVGNMRYNNPLSFKNMLMKTLIGHKPVPNTKQAKPFF